MRFPTTLSIPITLILLILTIGCDRTSSLITPSKENIEIITIGPYTETCQGFIEQ